MYYVLVNFRMLAIDSLLTEHRQMRRKLDGKVHALTSATQDVASLEQFNERAATTAYSSVRHPKLMN